jgi:hypothetical protein
MLSKIIESYPDEEILCADGFDDAVIGIESSTMRLIYSTRLCIAILCRDMSFEDAVDYFAYNVSGSYMGERTPIWCDDIYFLE